MNPLIALWAITVLSAFASWSCISSYRKYKKSTGKNKAKTKAEFLNSFYGTLVVVIITVLTWVL